MSTISNSVLGTTNMYSKKNSHFCCCTTNFEQSAKQCCLCRLAVYTQQFMFPLCCNTPVYL